MTDMTGQIFFRETGSKAPGLTREHKLLMFVGIVAVAPDSPLLDEHQYELMEMTLSPTGTDLTEVARGCQIGQMLLKPIWRV